MIHGSSTRASQLHLRRYVIDKYIMGLHSIMWLMNRELRAVYMFVFVVVLYRLCDGEHSEARRCHPVPWVRLPYSLQETNSQKYVFPFFLCLIHVYLFSLTFYNGFFYRFNGFFWNLLWWCFGFWLCDWFFYYQLNLVEILFYLFDPCNLRFQPISNLGHMDFAILMPWTIKLATHGYVQWFSH